MRADPDAVCVRVGMYDVWVDRADERNGAFRAKVEALPALSLTPGLSCLGRGRHTTVVVPSGWSGLPWDVAVKRFGRQGAGKDRVDRLRGTKACRAWLAAMRLVRKGVGTPPPVVP